MTKEEHIAYWLETAESDFDVAETLLSSGKNLWCLFISHLVIEKVLKAHYVNIFDETPPKIHNLLRLASKCNINLKDDELSLLDDLNLYQISTRYPEYKSSLKTRCTEEYTRDMFHKVKAMYQWLISQM
jgi:HEPN domain-containing protein